MLHLINEWCFSKPPPLLKGDQHVATSSKHFYAVFLLATVIVFQIFLFSLFGLQRPQFVQIYIPEELREVDDDVRNITLPALFLPLNQSDSIFAFVHLRKAGGMSIRSSLVPYFKFRGENFTNVVMIFACEWAVRCGTYIVDGFLGRVVSSAMPVRVLGHFSFGEVQKITKLRNHTVDCFTQFRHPLNRTLSCFYYRNVEEKKPKNISSFSQEGFRAYMSTYRDLYGNGCNNEILRMFTTEKNETFLNDPMRVNATKARELAEVAKNNIAQCVVLLVEKPEQNMVIGAEFFPEFSDLVVGRRENSQKYTEDVNTLDKGYLDVIYDQNSIDMELYEFGYRWHQRLYRFAAKNKFMAEELKRVGGEALYDYFEAEEKPAQHEHIRLW